jgi:hypothetical protein
VCGDANGDCLTVDPGFALTVVGPCCDVVSWPPLSVFPGVDGWVNVTPIMMAVATLAAANDAFRRFLKPISTSPFLPFAVSA